jgi:hypothetical protein
MNRPYLQNYLTFYYEYLPQMQDYHIKKSFCTLDTEEKDDTVVIDIVDED